MILFFLLISCFFDGQTEFFIDIDVRIILSRISHMRIAENINSENNERFNVINSYYRHLKNYKDECKITKYDNKYTIQIGSSFLCKDGKKLVKCANNKNITHWNISQQNFGYKIKNKNFCLSYGKNGLFLDYCKEKVENIFDFTISSPYLECALALINPNKKNKRLQHRFKKIDKDHRKKNLMRILQDDRLKDDIKAIEQEYFENESPSNYINELLPEVKGNKKMERVMKQLWDKTYKIPWYKRFSNWLTSIFC